MKEGDFAMEDLSGFLDFAAGVMGVPRGRLAPETAYGSIPEWDSVTHLRLVMETEERYGTSIPMEDIPRLATLADFHRAAQSGGSRE